MTICINILGSDTYSFWRLEIHNILPRIQSAITMTFKNMATYFANVTGNCSTKFGCKGSNSSESTGKTGFSFED